MILTGEGLTVHYRRGDRPALRGVSVRLEPGAVIAIVGPNGSGKTTLLRALTGAAPLSEGGVTVLGRPLAEWRARDLARVIGVVAQREETVFPLLVRDTVALGRYAHLGPVAAAGDGDRRIVEDAMQRADVAEFATRRTDTLSGGEWQRVRIARALAQEPRALLLDEPTASLDVRHEMEVFELIRRLAGEGIGSLVVSHHLNLAARYADRMLLLDRGEAVAEGSPAEVLRPETVSAVFRWPVAVTTWGDGAPQVVPLKPGEESGG
jgi:ABC-type cobalamin/Fe3+-siderophores transport system ATPase subunit